MHELIQPSTQTYLEVHRHTHTYILAKMHRFWYIRTYKRTGTQPGKHTLTYPHTKRNSYNSYSNTHTYKRTDANNQTCEQANKSTNEQLPKYTCKQASKQAIKTTYKRHMDRLTHKQTTFLRLFTCTCVYSYMYIHPCIHPSIIPSLHKFGRPCILACMRACLHLCI